jgi:hypothetical protein
MAGAHADALTRGAWFIAAVCRLFVDRQLCMCIQASVI